MARASRLLYLLPLALIAAGLMLHLHRAPRSVAPADAMAAIEQSDRR